VERRHQARIERQVGAGLALNFGGRGFIGGVATGGLDMQKLMAEAFATA